MEKKKFVYNDRGLSISRNGKCLVRCKDGELEIEDRKITYDLQTFTHDYSKMTKAEVTEVIRRWYPGF